MADNKKSIVFILGMFSILVLGLVLSPVSYAQSNSCAADFRTQLQNHARLAAERQVAISNTLIRKPDSVLEYTCFDQQAARVAEDVGPLFSESTAWNSQTVNITGQFGDDPATTFNTVNYSVNMGNTNMDGKINDLVFTTINNYVSGNFPHDFLGGSASGSDNNMRSSVASVEGVCDHLFSIYHVAKCEDFADDRPFTDFAGLAGADPRALPSTCSSTYQITTALIQQANNNNFAHTAFDQVTTYIDLIGNDSASVGSTCSLDPIPTGIIIQRRVYTKDISGNTILEPSESYDYEEKVCPSPGCYFDHGGDGNTSNDRCRQ